MQTSVCWEYHLFILYMLHVIYALAYLDWSADHPPRMWDGRRLCASVKFMSRLWDGALGSSVLFCLILTNLQVNVLKKECFQVFIIETGANRHQGNLEFYTTPLFHSFLARLSSFERLSLKQSNTLLLFYKTHSLQGLLNFHKNITLHSFIFFPCFFPILLWFFLNSLVT